jgi:hypothetical protein
LSQHSTGYPTKNDFDVQQLLHAPSKSFSLIL